MKSVLVKGISSIGTEREHNYLMIGYSDLNDFEAVKEALEWADEEYNVIWKDGEIVPNSRYKEFAKITSIEIIED